MAASSVSLTLASLLLACAGLASGRAQASAPSAPAELPCETGSYRLADGRVLDIGPGSEPGELRWRLPDGRTGALAPQGEDRWSSTLGWTGRPDGHVIELTDCGPEGLRFDDIEGRRIPLVQIDTRFQGSGVTLAGRLTLPPGNARVPLVVLVHGAEHTSAIRNYSLQRQFAAAGIGVFAYDKRGTGASGGRYTQNYLTLAIDAVLAMREARRLAGERAGRTGYQGGSQGGWIAPLAATIEPVDFVIVSFGLAVSVLQEDREAIAFDLRRAGLDADADIVAKAMEVADSTATIVASDFSEGFERLEALKAKYGDQPWFRHLRGNYTGLLLSMSPDELREKGPRLAEGLPATYDPRPVLSNLAVPQLWILGGQDRDAPPGETLRRLAVLRAAGSPITTAVFADADHGMYEFVTVDGERLSTRQPEGYFAMMRDFILGEPDPARYGDATIAGCGLSSPGGDPR